MPYALPIASIIVISAMLLFAKPSLTGFAVRENNPFLNAEIRITADEVLPEDAIISIYLSDRNNTNILQIEKSSVKDFVSKYNASLSYENGKNSQLAYEGKGYRGASNINLGRIELKDVRKGKYTLKVDIIYKETTASSTEQAVSI